MATRPKVTDWLDDEYRMTKLRGWARRGLMNDQIAQNMGISETTFYKWKAENAEFAKVLKEDKDYCDDMVENALYKSALEGNTTAQIFYLKNRRRSDWRDKQELEVSGEVGIGDAIRQARERLNNET